MYKSVEDLYCELDERETTLEVWGRTDGASLLMRVLHVLQLRVCSTDPRQTGKFLFSTWQQYKDGRARVLNRTLSKKLKNDGLFDEARFTAASVEAVNDNFTYLEDTHFRLDPKDLPRIQERVPRSVTVHGVEVLDHYIDVVESPSYKGMSTLYHLYTIDVVCDGLPLSDFVGLLVPKTGVVSSCHGWRWVNWNQCLDLVHTRSGELDSQLSMNRRTFGEQQRLIQSSSHLVNQLNGVLTQLSGSAKNEAERLLVELRKKMDECEAAAKKVDRVQDEASVIDRLPPSMITKMGQNTIASEGFLARAFSTQIDKARRSSHEKCSTDEIDAHGLDTRKLCCHL